MRPLVGILGFIAGMLVGLGLLLTNPVVLIGGLEPLRGSGALVKHYHLDDARGIQVGVAQLLGIGRGRAETSLGDPANRNVRIGVTVLPAGDGWPAALAVKISVLTERNSLWRARLGMLDYWNVFWPGEGSVFAAGYSNFWSLARDLVWATVRGKGRAGLAASYDVSASPPAGDLGGVIGASGRYAGFTGDLRESIAPRGDGSPDWTLRLAIGPAQSPGS